jgi:hypothetical protein
MPDAVLIPQKSRTYVGTKDLAFCRKAIGGSIARLRRWCERRLPTRIYRREGTPYCARKTIAAGYLAGEVERIVPRNMPDVLIQFSPRIIRE